MSNKGTMSDWLSEHPRMIGVLFMIGLLLMQAAPVVATGAEASPGP
ncbi:DUF7503 family protein [Haloarchaeobius salinus]|nr:hypothetical protein [Haloarchaeobius salinus]